jgi:hypothetical protein
MILMARSMYPIEYPLGPNPPSKLYFHCLLYKLLIKLLAVGPEDVRHLATVQAAHFRDANAAHIGSILQLTSVLSLATGVP